tara:strand:- start:15 stop:518 length:504 start_codon:yes stop_codon:yes gene_type:complete
LFKLSSLLIILKPDRFYFYILILLFLDILTKQFALSSLSQGVSKDFIPFIDLLLIYNSGIAFGFLDFGERFFSNILMFIGIGIVIYILILLKEEKEHLKKIALSFIAGGALGNIVDRLPDGYVTDFLHLKINNFSFFIFNFADASISLGAFLIIYLEIFKKDHAERK